MSKILKWNNKIIRVESYNNYMGVEVIVALYSQLYHLESVDVISVRGHFLDLIFLQIREKCVHLIC